MMKIHVFKVFILLSHKTEYKCLCTCGFLRLSVLGFFLRVLTICMMPLAAGKFDCKTLYSSPGRSWYRNDLLYIWIIIKGYFPVVYLCYHNRSINHCSHRYSLPMDQQDEGTTQVTVEKVNLRGGLGAKQTSHLYLSWGNILILGGTFKSYYRKKT